MRESRLRGGGIPSTLVQRARDRITSRAQRVSNRAAKLNIVSPLGPGGGGGFPGGGGFGPGPGGFGPTLPPLVIGGGGGGGGGGFGGVAEGILEGLAGGGGLGGGAVGGLCSLLPANMQDLCRQAGGAILGGGGGGGGGTGGGSGLAPGCPEGTIRVGDTCVAPGDAFPGGDPFTTGAGGTPTLGRYGVAMTPTVEQRAYRRCPDGMRLGDDNLCYDRAVMGRRSNKRKWKAPKKPPITVRQMNALKALESARSAVRDLAGSADLKVQSKAAAARKSGFLKGRGVKTS